tara:strand:+ start:1206 stop:1412 length:207 start_codon:yes stop_codon:yes gene_type:complete
VKKVTPHTNHSNKDFERNKDIELDKIKTTNINILLNRVRLNKKKQIKKKIILTVFIFIIPSLIVMAVF